MLSSSGWPLVNDLWIPSGGIKKGEMSIFIAKGRQTGKSTMNQMYMNGIFGKSAYFRATQVDKAYKGEWCVKAFYQDDAEIHQWLKDTFGEGGRNHRYRWRKNYVKEGVYFLRHEADVLLFRLRWM